MHADAQGARRRARQRHHRAACLSERDIIAGMSLLRGRQPATLMQD
jgi:hypothetical protein